MLLHKWGILLLYFQISVKCVHHKTKMFQIVIASLLLVTGSRLFFVRIATSRNHATLSLFRSPSVAITKKNWNNSNSTARIIKRGHNRYRVIAWETWPSSREREGRRKCAEVATAMAMDMENQYNHHHHRRRRRCCYCSSSWLEPASPFRFLWCSSWKSMVLRAGSNKWARVVFPTRSTAAQTLYF